MILIITVMRISINKKQISKNKKKQCISNDNHEMDDNDINDDDNNQVLIQICSF